MTSLWWDTLPPDLLAPIGPRLDGDVDADVAIVGAGYTGLWTAYYLLTTSPGIRIAILEAQHAGFGASGRNGGWASALFPASLDAVARVGDRDGAIRQQRAMFDTVDEIGRVARAEEWDIHWAKGGTIVAARTPLQWQRAQEEIAHWRSWGFGAEDTALLGSDEARGILGATDVLGATYTPHCAAIHPARLVRSLARTVAARGARIFEQSPAKSIEPGIVTTATGRVRASYVVRATEGYTPSLPGYRRAMAPVYSLMIATEPLSAADWDRIGLADRPTFSDGRHLIIYGQRTADGRLAFGGRGAPYHFGSRIKPEYDRDPRVFAELWRCLTDLFPHLAGRAVTHSWGGALGVPRDWFASCGLDRATGMAWGGGYVGDGVGTSNLAGRTLADLISDRSTDLTSLPWVDHRSPDWEPEPIRWFGANVGLRVMGSADHVEARTGRPARRAKVFSRFLGE
ncbi:MAG: NAD(P)/FAD-dependent oxidoreductase [Actinomycetota bacterium]